MTINVQNLEKFKSYGFALTPVTKSLDPEEDKKPHLKDFKWSTDWTDQELLDANRIGAFHKDSKIFDVDIDDKKYIANKFYDLLPPTFTIGKKVNGQYSELKRFGGLYFTWDGDSYGKNLFEVRTK